MAPTASTSTPKQPLPKSFSSAQAKKAVDALLTHAKKAATEKEETELIAREESVWLIINTKSGATKKKTMPVRIQLPYPPIAPPPATSVCLITKDPQREYKDLLAAHNIKFISRVVGVEKLKGKFKPFEARRQLMQDHDIWLCDDRVLPIMPKLLGKMFMDAKKKPIPVNVRRKDLKAELARAIDSTYFHPSTGTSHSIKVSSVSTNSSSQTLENLLATIPSAISQFPDGWQSVLNMGIKTNSSVMLPVWNSPLNGRFKDKDASEETIVDEEMKEEVETPKTAVKIEKAIAKPKSILKSGGEKALKKTSKIAGGGANRTKSAILGKSR